MGGVTLAVYCFSRSGGQQETAGDSSAASPRRRGGAGFAPLAPLTPVKRSTVTVSAEEQRKIDAAIVKGVWYLKGCILPSGTWGDVVNKDGWPGVSLGFASLPALTMLECGVAVDDPVILKAAEFVRKQATVTRQALDTYQRALAILFLDRLGDPRDEELIQYLALCLIAGQRQADGGWDYVCPTLDPKMTPDLLALLRYNKQTPNDWKKKALKGGTYEPGQTDNSNTQFAVLALWVARRHNVPINQSMTLVEKRFRTSQQPKGKDPRGFNVDMDGSWVYSLTRNQRSVSPWPTMTCAGLLGLAVSQGLAESGPGQNVTPLDDPGVKRGLSMLAREINRPGERRPLDLYFLWSLERVGVLYGLEKIENKDWYAWGRGLILPRQQPDGSWKDGGAWYASNPVIDTSFALLFLKQANLAADLTTKLQLLGTKQ
jgi:hypothetical protein